MQRGGAKLGIKTSMMQTMDQTRSVEVSLELNRCSLKLYLIEDSRSVIAS